MTTKIETKNKLKNLIDEISSSELSSIGSIVLKILEMIKNPQSTATDLQEIIELDPPLSAKILRRVNSAEYGLGRQVTSIQESIVFMGFNAIKELALNLKVGDFFRDTVEINGYSKRMLWKHSLGVALCCKYIYRREFQEKGDAIYSAGLLHDIGIIAVDQYSPDAIFQITEKVKEGTASIVALEQRLLGFDHARVAKELTKSWKLPNDIVNCVAYHHYPFRASQDFAREVYTIYIADYLCIKHDIGFVGEKNPDHITFEKCCKILELEPLSLEIIIEDVIEELIAMEKREEF